MNLADHVTGTSMTLADHVIRVGGFLSFLGTAALLAIGVLVVLHALVTRKPEHVMRVAVAMGALVAIYGAVLVSTSLASRERVIIRGDEKYFCDLDCDLSFSVMAVRTVRAIGTARATGAFHIVSVRGRSIAARVEMFLPSPRVAIVDRDGRRFAVSAAGQHALERVQGVGPSLDERLPPGGTFVTDLVFDLPDDAREPRLILIGGERISRIIIGDENALLHRKTVLALSPGEAVTRNCTLVQGGDPR